MPCDQYKHDSYSDMNSMFLNYMIPTFFLNAQTHPICSNASAVIINDWFQFMDKLKYEVPYDQY